MPVKRTTTSTPHVRRMALPFTMAIRELRLNSDKQTMWALEA